MVSIKSYSSPPQEAITQPFPVVGLSGCGKAGPFQASRLPRCGSPSTKKDFSLHYREMAHNSHYSYLNAKLDFMKQTLKGLFELKEKTHDKFRLGSTILMILIFLTFWGVSFYVLVNSLA